MDRHSHSAKINAGRSEMRIRPSILVPLTPQTAQIDFTLVFSTVKYFLSDKTAVQTAVVKQTALFKLWKHNQVSSDMVILVATRAFPPSFTFTFLSYLNNSKQLQGHGT